MENRTEWKKFLVPVLAVVVTAAVVWFTNQPVTQRQVRYQDVVEEAEAGGYGLVDTERLKALLDKDPRGLLLVDTRQEWEYRTGHIPSAVHFAMEPTRWARWSKKGELQAALGPDKDRTIVFY